MSHRLVLLSIVGGSIWCSHATAVDSPPEVIATAYTEYEVKGLTLNSSGRMYYADWVAVHPLSPDLLEYGAWHEPACGAFSVAAGSEFLYVTDGSRGEECFNDLFKFDLDGRLLKSWCDETAQCGGIHVALDSEGNLIVSDRDILRKYDSDGSLLGERYGDDPTSDFGEAAVGKDGSLLVPDRTRGEVLKLSSDLTGSEVFIAHGSVEGTVSVPYGLAVGPDGDVFVMDRGRRQIQRYDSSGRFLLAWDQGYLGGPAVVDELGYLYVAVANSIQKFDNKPGSPSEALPPHAAAILFHVGKDVGRTLGCVSIPKHPSEIVTLGDSDASGAARYFLYLLASPSTLDGPLAGITGMQMGLQAEDPSGNVEKPLSIFNWTRCSVLDFPQDGWPASGTGNTITWSPSVCQQSEIVLAGYMYVSSYAPAIVRITGYPAFGVAKVAKCGGAESVVQPSSLGWVSFGKAETSGSVSGCNPLYQDCSGVRVGVESTTWGKLKALY